MQGEFFGFHRSRLIFHKSVPLNRSVAGSYDNEGIAIFCMLFTYYLWIKSVKTGFSLRTRIRISYLTRTELRKFSNGNWDKTSKNNSPKLHLVKKIFILTKSYFLKYVDWLNSFKNLQETSTGLQCVPWRISTWFPPGAATSFSSIWYRFMF